jgi:hypothetical protein
MLSEHFDSPIVSHLPRPRCGSQRSTGLRRSSTSFHRLCLKAAYTAELLESTCGFEFGRPGEIAQQFLGLASELLEIRMLGHLPAGKFLFHMSSLLET